MLVAFADTVRATLPETFAAIFAPLECEAAALSPDGKRLASVMRVKGVLTAYVTDLEEMAVKASVVLSKDLTGHRGDSRLHWTSNNRIVVQIGIRDIVAFDANGAAITWLINWRKDGWFRPAIGRVDDPLYNPFDSSAPPPVVVADPNSRPTPLRRVRIVALPSTEPDHVYVEGIGAGSGSGPNFALYRIHVQTGALETVRQESVQGFLVYDRQGQPRLRLSNFGGLPHRWHLRAAEDQKSSWIPLDRNLSAPDKSAFDISTPVIFGTRSFPLGFDDDANLLYIASNAGRDTYGIHALDLRTGRRTAFGLDHPTFDLASPLDGLAGSFGGTPESTLVFDREKRTLAGVRHLGLRATTRWIDAEIAGVQRRLEAQNPTASVQIEHWDAARNRFLVQIFSRSDPGSYAIFEPVTDRLRRILPRGPQESPLQPMRTVPWEFKRPDGAPLTGEITMPSRPRGNPAPVVVFFRQSEWSRQSMRYNPEIAALAHLGFAIVEVNHRGLAGFGTRHWLAGRLNADTVAAEDAFAAVDHLAARIPLEREKVVFYGNAFGGYFALRAAQLFPLRTAGVVTFNPIVDLPDWIAPSVPLSDSSRLLYDSRGWFFGSDAKTRREHSPVHHSAALTQPVLIVTTYESAHTLYSGFVTLEKKAKTAGGTLVIERVRPGADLAERGPVMFAAAEKFLDGILPTQTESAAARSAIPSPSSTASPSVR